MFFVLNYTNFYEKCKTLLLYFITDIATGGAYDWAKLKMNIKYAYAFELRPSQNGRNGFIIPKRNIKPSSLELFAALKTFAKGFR